MRDDWLMANSYGKLKEEAQQREVGWRCTLVPTLESENQKKKTIVHNLYYWYIDYTYFD